MTASVSDITDITTIPAAYAIPFDKTVIGQGESIELRYFREVDVPKGDPSYNYFNGLHTEFVNSTDNFQNVSHTVLNNNMYFATGYDEICKYDGNKIYRAGLPQPETSLITTAVDTTVNNPVDTDGFSVGVSHSSQEKIIITCVHINTLITIII